jgi:uncharacterized membrane protein
MKQFAVLAAIWALPLLTFAQQVRSIQDAGVVLTNIINGVLVPMIFAIAFLVFIWGVVNFFLLGAKDEEAREKGRNYILYGIIAFFVMVSVWGLVNILVGTFNLSSGGPSNIPVAPGPR